MNHYTPTQWVFGIVRLWVLVSGFIWTARDAFFPRPGDNLKRHQRIIRGAGAILFGTMLLVAIPIWLWELFSK
jgi:hypothetical protein